jgi:hypothetical protein
LILKILKKFYFYGVDFNVHSMNYIYLAEKGPKKSFARQQAVWDAPGGLRICPKQPIALVGAGLAVFALKCPNIPRRLHAIQDLNHLPTRF